MTEILYMSVGLPESVRQRCEGWVHRFGEIVAGEPFQIRCNVREVDGDLRGRLEAILDQEDFVSVTASAIEFMACEQWQLREGQERVLLPKLVILCDSGNPLVAAVQKTNPGALWGAAIGSLAVVYHQEQAVVWHEMFHLFGAHDCYEGDSTDEAILPTCGNVDCLMQFAPTLDRVGDPPFLCGQNIQRVRETCAKMLAD
jgi:hypothetical protein